MTEWRDVKGYEGLYQISQNGDVRKLMFVNNRVRKPKIKALKSHDNGNGYIYITLHKNGSRKNFYVHRLVMLHFGTGNPQNEVHHKDFNKKNNSNENLEWSTRVENVSHSVEHMGKPKNKCKPTNTNEKYIRIRRGRYCLYIRKMGFYKSFASLKEAKAKRDELVKGLV